MTNVTAKTAALAWALIGLSAGAWGQPGSSPGPTNVLYQKLQTVGLDKARVYKIREAALDRAAIHLSLDDGTIAFTSDVDGRITGALFRGDGELLLSPTDANERASLAFFTGAAILEEKFSTAYLRFNDDVYGDLKKYLRPPEDAEAFFSESNATAQNLAQEDALRLLNSFVNATASADSQDHFLHAYLQGERLGLFDVRYDALAPEQISAGAHKTTEGEDFYDVWTSFALRAHADSGSPSTLRVPDYDITDFKINARISPPTQLEAKADLTVVPKASGRRMLLFELSRLLQIKQVEADGNPVEFIHNPSIEGSQLARQGNDIVAVILPSPTQSGQKLTLSFDYAGAVISEAANGLLYVGEHGTWYPNIGFKMASYDLEFRCPAGWTLVATGKRTQATSSGGEQVSRWISDRPIPVAGFNLGKYSREAIQSGHISVEAYATSNVERGFPQLSADSSSNPELFRQTSPLAMKPAVEVPSPARNAQRVARTAARALEFYQQRFGPYPYSQLSLTQFPGRISQGWPGLVFLASYVFLTPTEREAFQPDPRLRLALEQTTAHEVAHQWWGDLVTWNGYRDQWIMEALANYSALMLLESSNPAGFRQVMQQYRDDLLQTNHDGQRIADSGPVTLGFRLSSSHFADGYDAISYGRGTWLIHMLRCMLADGDRKSGRSKDESFLRALQKLRTEYAGQAVTSAELIHVFESELHPSLSYEGHKSLDWFYEGWVNGSAVPAFALREVKFTQRSATTTVSGIIEQQHAPATLVTAVPVYAVISGGRSIFVARVFADGKETPFHLSVPAGTRKLVIDPEQTLLSRSK